MLTAILTVLVVLLVLLGVITLAYAAGLLRRRPRLDSEDDPASQHDPTLRMTAQEASSVRDQALSDASRGELDEAQSTIFCTSCGARGHGKSIFCERCGSRFDIASIRQQLSWLSPSVELTIGRNPASDVRLFHPTASDRHARVTFIKGSLLLEDFGSSNGTRIEEALLEQPTLLVPGDTVSFGRDVRTYDFLVSALIEKARAVSG